MNELSKMNIPPVYQVTDFSLHDFTNKNGILSVVKTVGVSAQERTNLVLCSGISGIGKTRLAVGWLYHLWINDKRTVTLPDRERFERYDTARYHFINCREYDIKFEFGGFNLPDLIDKTLEYKRAIVIDDLGRENDKASRAYLR
jgi:DNA replication protein DnaC